MPVVPSYERLIRRLELGFMDLIPSQGEGPRFNPFEKYAGDFARFGRDVLGESYTPEIREMMESVDRHPITGVMSANAVGKTHAAARVGAAYFLMYPDSQVYTAAAPPKENLENLLWGEIGSIVEKHPHLFSGTRISLPSMMVRRSALSFITGVTIPTQGTPAQRQARFSGKHAPRLLFILDEADAIPWEIYEAIESCMSGGHARLLFLFNPRHESGPTYRMDRDNIANMVSISALTHPNVVTGKDVYPGAVTREKTVRRINLWTREPFPGEKPDETFFEVPSYLVGAIAHSDKGNPYPPLKVGWRKVLEPEFYYMVLARYPAMAENQLISSEWINQANSRWYAIQALHGGRPPSIFPYGGFDVAEEGGDLNVLTLRYGSFVDKQEWWSGVGGDIIASGEKAAQIGKANACVWVNVDATGVGAGAVPAINRNGLKAHRIMVASSPDKTRMSEEDKERGEFNRLRDQMLWNLREWLRTDSGAALPPDDLLREELLAPTYGKTITGKMQVSGTDSIKEKIQRSPDRLMSLALTFAPFQEVQPGKVRQKNMLT